MVGPIITQVRGERKLASGGIWIPVSRRVVTPPIFERGLMWVRIPRCRMASLSVVLETELWLQHH